MIKHDTTEKKIIIRYTVYIKKHGVVNYNLTACLGKRIDIFIVNISTQN